MSKLDPKFDTLEPYAKRSFVVQAARKEAIID